MVDLYRLEIVILTELPYRKPFDVLQWQAKLIFFPVFAEVDGGGGEGGGGVSLLLVEVNVEG